MSMITNTVYIHIFPNGKRYVGVTQQKLIYRWGNGSGYAGTVVGRAIKKYGWENIKHEIMFENLSREMAFEKEILLIKLYNTNNIKYGYNITSGGMGSHGLSVSKETRKKLSNSNKGQKRNEAFCKRLSEVNLGKKHSEETKNKISLAIKKQLLDGPRITEQGRRRLSEIHKGHKYNLGRIHSEEHNKKISKALIGIKRSEDTRGKMSKSMKGLHKNKFWFTDGVNNKRCFICPDGYYGGRTLRKKELSNIDSGGFQQWET